MTYTIIIGPNVGVVFFTVFSVCTPILHGGEVHGIVTREAHIAMEIDKEQTVLEDAGLGGG